MAFEDQLERELGKLCLFALVRNPGFRQRWKVYLSAPWLESDPDAGRRAVTAKLVSWLDRDERVELGGVVAASPHDPFVCSLMDLSAGRELPYEIRDVEIGRVEVEHGVILGSCRAA